MHIYGIVDLFAVGFVAFSDVSVSWLKYGVLALLLIKGLHSQLA